MIRNLMMSTTFLVVAVVSLGAAPVLACEAHGKSADAKTNGGTKPFAAGTADAGTKPELSTSGKTDGGTKLQLSSDTKTDGGTKLEYAGDAKTDGGTKPYAADTKTDGGTKPYAADTKADGGSKPYAADTKTDGGSKPFAAETKTDGGTKFSAATEFEELLAATCSCTGKGDCTCKKGECKCSKCSHQKSVDQEHSRVIEQLGGKSKSTVIPQEARREATAGTFI